MNWLDAVLAIILVASVITSIRKGLSREVIGLVAVVLALLSGIWFYGTAGSFLLHYLSSRTAANLAGFLVVFCGVMLLGSVVSWVTGKFLRVTGLSFFDHLLGAAFGVARGVLIAVAVITGIMAFTPAGKAPASVVDSRMAPYVVTGARVFVAMAPHELKQGFRESYVQVKAAWGKALEKGARTAAGTDKGSHEK